MPKKAKQEQPPETPVPQASAETDELGLEE